MYIISSSSTSERTVPTVEPPGGEALLRARAILDRMIPAASDAEHEQAASLVAEVPPFLLDTPREPFVYECGLCGWYPATRVRPRRYAALLFSSSGVIRVESLCRRCGMRRYYGFQAMCCLFGFLGVGLIVTPFVMLANVRNKWRLRPSKFSAITRH